MYREDHNPAAVMVETPSVHLAITTTATRDTSAQEEAGSPLITAAIAGADSVGSAALRSLLRQTGLVNEIQEWAWLNEVRLRHAQDVPDVVFLDLSNGAGSEFVFVQELCKLRPSVHTVACTFRKELDPDFLLQAMRAGIREFVQKPFDRIELTALMHRLAQEFAVQPAKKTAAGRLFVTVGTKGGVGTSTVAVNLAVQLARIPEKKTVLLDFSRPMGDVAGLLDLKPVFQFRDAVHNVKRLDATLLEGLLTTHKSGLRVLCGAARLEDWQDALLPVLERIVEVAQQSFDFVVMDLGAFYSAEWQDILAASEVLLVTEADLPGLAKLHKHLIALTDLRVSSRQVRLIVNRWHRQDEEALAKVENDMRMPVFARLPNNFKEVRDATVRGVPVAKSGDPLTAGFASIAARLSGTESSEPEPRKKFRLAQLLSF